MRKPRGMWLGVPATLASAIAVFAFAQHRLHNQGGGSGRVHAKWMDASLSPDERAEMVLKEMTLDEKMNLVHGNGMPGWGKPRPNAYLGNGGAGFLVGGPGGGVSMIQMSDGADGGRGSGGN